MDYLPLSLQLRNAECLIIGGGSIALRKSRPLLKAGANLTLIAPEFHSDLEKLAKENKIRLIRASFQIKHLEAQLLVIAATNDLEVNQLIYNEASKKRILVNTVDQPKLCQFIMPAIIDRSPLTIAISSSGVAPVFARMLREKIEWLLPINIGDLLFHLKGKRESVKEKYPQLSQRRYFWEGYFEKVLNWSARDTIKSDTPRELELDKILNIFSEYKTTDQLKSELTIIKLPNNNLSHDDLTIRNLKALQKADDVYLTAKHYALLENVIRRDAELHLIDESKIAETITEITEMHQQTSHDAQVVIINDLTN